MVQCPRCFVKVCKECVPGGVHPTCEDCKSGLEVLVNAPPPASRKRTAGAAAGAATGGRKSWGKKRFFKKKR